MINHRTIRIALRQPFLDAAIVAFDDSVSWELESFNPAGKDLWLQEKLLPASDAPNSDAAEGMDGIYQMSIFVPAAEGIAEDGRRAILEDYANQIANLYTPNQAPLPLVNGEVTIDTADGLTIQKDDNWMWKPVSIVFRATQLNS